MCITPSHIWIEKGPGYEQLPVPCKECWRCRANRVNDYVGRALCEASTSDSVCALTLTYAPRDDLADKVLTARHFQHFVKRLRKAGHKVRYIVAGEYGELKGRAHFHAVLFFKGQAPDIPHKRICHISEWPHGHVFADWTASDRALRYVCKYILKRERGKGWFSISKKPTLGAEYFARRAKEYAAQGILPRGFEYYAPGGQKSRPYMLTGATKRDLLALTIKLLGEKIPDPSTRSEWVQKGIEKVELWQHMRNIPQQETDEFLADMLERLDRDRLTDEQSDMAVLRAHEFSRYHGREMLERMRKNGAQIEATQRKGFDSDEAEWR